MKRVALIALGSLFCLNLLHAQVLIPKQEGKLWGFTNERDSFVIAPKYTAVGEFKSDYTWVNIGGKTKYAKAPEGGKWGVIDTKGNEVCPVQYEYVDFCVNGKVAVNVGGKMKNLYITGGKWGYVDLTTGKEIIPPTYGHALPFCAEGAAWVEKGGSTPQKVWALLSHDTKGKVESAERLFDVTSPLSLAFLFDHPENVGLWALIDANGNKLLDFDYSNVGPFINGVAWAEKDGKYGMVDATGGTTIPFEYAKLSNCYNDVVWAWNSGGKIALLTKFGEALTEAKYSDVTAFADDVTWAKIGELYCLIDCKGTELTPARYSKVGEFSNGVAHVWSDKNAIGAVTKDGKQIIRTMYGTCAERFGVTQFKFSDGQQVYSFFTHPQMGNVWVDQSGKTVAQGVKVVYTVTDVVPNALWDY